jgi:phage gp36-like protein
MENFLQPEDYNPQIRNQILTIITGDVDDTLHTAELAAQEEMESYLRVRYNVGTIFSLEQEIADRKKIIVMYLVDITLYHLHANITPDNVPEIRYLRYQRAMEWLKKVADGKISPDLPELEIPFENGGSQFFEGGSNEKVTERY